MKDEAGASGPAAEWPTDAGLAHDAGLSTAACTTGDSQHHTGSSHRCTAVIDSSSRRGVRTYLPHL